jgi:glycosyltransferase involved in cell wall biosynthesis
VNQPEHLAAALSTSSRRKLAELLVPDAEIVEPGRGFDELAPAADLISVIVPSYAHEEFVQEAIRSITQQTYRKLELILVDDNSPDRTFDLALQSLRGAEIPYCAIRRRHAGLETNLNAGILLARGGWIAMLASDDLFPERSMEALLSAAQAGGVDVAVGSVEEISREGALRVSRAAVVARYAGMSGDALRKALLEEHGSMMIQGMLISRHVFARVGLFDPELFASDFDFLLRMASRGVRFAAVPDATALHRQTRKHLSSEHLGSGLRSHLAIARRHARSPLEYRRATARFRVETALNSFHYKHHWDAAAYLAQACLTAPFVTVRIVATRVLGKLRGTLS